MARPVSASSAVPRSIPAAALLLAALHAGSAAAGDWVFTYTHLCDSANQCIALSGTFSGVDANGDGTLALGELQGLEAGGYILYPNYTSPPGQLPIDVRTTAFSFGAAGLSFAATAMYYRTAVNVLTGSAFSVTGPGEPVQGHFDWTPQTTLQVSVVPEPATPLLLGVGLLAVLAFARRRRDATNGIAPCSTSPR